MARVIDDRGRLLGKINIVDLIVLVLIVALAVFFGLRAGGQDVAGTTSPEKVSAKIHFVFEFTELRTVDAILSTVDGTVWDKDGRKIGTIERVTSSLKEPVDVNTWGFNLSINLAPVYQVNVVVAAEGYLEEDGVHVGPLAARAGSSLEVVGPGWEGWGRIVQVDHDAPESE